jgi:hypothetical protein
MNLMLFPQDQEYATTRVRESQLRKVVGENQIPGVYCSAIQYQIQKKLTACLESSLSLDLAFFRVQCHGTWVNRTALYSDEMRVLVVLKVEVPEQDIISSLTRCDQISHVRSEESCCRFQFTISLQGATYTQILKKWQGVGGLDTISCSLEVVQHSDLRHDEYSPFFSWANLIKVRERKCFLIRSKPGRYLSHNRVLKAGRLFTAVVPLPQYT